MLSISNWKKSFIFLHLVHEKAAIVAQWCPLGYHWSPFLMVKWSCFAIPCPISSSACCLLPIWLQAFRDPVLIDFCKICSQILIIVFIYVYIYIFSEPLFYTGKMSTSDLYFHERSWHENYFHIPGHFLWKGDNTVNLWRHDDVIK